MCGFCQGLQGRWEGQPVERMRSVRHKTRTFIRIPSPAAPLNTSTILRIPEKKKKLENIPVSLKWGKEIWHVNDGGCIENGIFHPSSFMTSDISIELLQYNLCLKFQLWKGPGSISLTRGFGTKTVLKASLPSARSPSAGTGYQLSLVSGSTTSSCRWLTLSKWSWSLWYGLMFLGNWGGWGVSHSILLMIWTSDWKVG